MNKQEWKTFYRKIRVIRRESWKVAMDAMIYGTGVMHVPDDGSDVERIHPSKNDMNKNTDAIDRAMKKANAADTNLLMDTRSILIAIQKKLPEYRR